MVTTSLTDTSTYALDSISDLKQNDNEFPTTRLNSEITILRNTTSSLLSGIFEPSRYSWFFLTQVCDFGDHNPEFFFANWRVIFRCPVRLVFFFHIVILDLNS